MNWIIAGVAYVAFMAVVLAVIAEGTRGEDE